MSRRIKVPRAALIQAAAQSIVSSAIGKLALARTVPEYCRRVRWPEGDLVAGVARGHAFVGIALAAYAAGAVHQVVKVPAFMRVHLAWDALCRQHGRGESQDLVTVAHIVEGFSPDTWPVGHAERLDTLLGIEARRAVEVPA